MAKKRCALRIESARQKIERDAPAIGAQNFRIAHAGERMIIGDEVKRFALGLQRDGRSHHAEVIADVQNATGLNTGEDATGSLICNSERSRRLSVVSTEYFHPFARNSKRFLDFARNDKCFVLAIFRASR